MMYFFLGAGIDTAFPVGGGAVGGGSTYKLATIGAKTAWNYKLLFFGCHMLGVSCIGSATEVWYLLINK